MVRTLQVWPLDGLASSWFGLTMVRPQDVSASGWFGLWLSWPLVVLASGSFCLWMVGPRKVWPATWGWTMIYNRCLNAATSQQVYSLLGLLHLGQLSFVLALVYQLHYVKIIVCLWLWVRSICISLVRLAIFFIPGNLVLRWPNKRESTLIVLNKISLK